MSLRPSIGKCFGPGLDRAACLAEIGACIAEVEASSSAKAATVRILARTGYDATDAMEALWREMDTLTTLRHVRDHLRAECDLRAE
ncbi:hypothetical protein ASF49_17555 [Methylobacterium sp. Leaf104]|uniref:hypothetical protein n=1 Tax=Methylobacterium TaxID=407 RepID=UPI0006FA58EB|nr:MULTISPECIES: hypothetical protein [Methylobacterium]KQP41186.1 hypothetical protein ASF49_17555 [Methylobacterium sp. Leaf104]MCI9879434.1 hypothetical protein [Methylobacterium goesingense]